MTAAAERTAAGQADEPLAAGRGFDPRVWLLALGTFAIGTDAFVVSGILPAVAGDLRVGLEAAGQVVTAYALTYALGAPLLAAFTARLPRGRTVTVALGIFALANAPCALAPSYPLLIAARVMAGVAAALYTPTAYALAASLAQPDRKGSALAAVALGLTASAVLGVPFGAFLGQRLGWHATFWFVALLSAAAVTVLLSSPPRGASADGAAPAGLGARFAPLARPAVLLALLPSLLWCTANFTSYTYLGAALAERHAPDAVVALFLIYGLGGLAGSQAGGRLADRFGPARPIVACLAFANQALLGLAGAGTITLGAALVVWSFTGWATFAPQQSRLIAIEPENGPLVIALNNSTIYLGSALGAALGGALILHGVPATGLHWATAALLAAALAASGVSLHGERTSCPIPPASAG